MLKRILAAVLCIISLGAVATFPTSANAEVLDGWTSKVDYDNTDPNKYVIEIDLKNQVITVYEGKIGGNIVIQSLCTTGDASHATNSGTYKLGDMKERFGYFVAFGQYAQYWTQVVRGIYIHSIMYNSTSLTSMSRTAYKKLGKNVSHGCVRVLPHVAQFIFYNCPPGTTCVITRKKAADAALVKRLKNEIPAYSDYKQPEDTKAYPAEIPGVIRYDNTPLRTGSSTKNDTTIDTLSSGTRVMLLQLAKDWCKVETEDGTLGYVKTEYILADPNDTDAVTIAYKAKSKTYVYKSMSTDSKKLVTIPSGAEVTVTSNPKKGWWYGSYNGIVGYMRTRYVKKSETVVYPTLDAVTVPDISAQGGSSGSNSSGGMFSNSRLNPTATPTPAPTTAPTASSQGNARIASGIVANMRSGAGTSYPVVASFSQGTAVTVISVEGTWYYCLVNGQYGYIYSGCLVIN